MDGFVEIDSGLWYEEKTGLPWSSRQPNGGPSRRTDYPMKKLKATPYGYFHNTIKKKRYYWHRLIYEFFKGEIPEKMKIDHIDGNPRNNLISNLQVLSPQENTQKMKINPRNKSGLPGVFWNKVDKIWTANIKTNNRTRYLGRFRDPFIAYSTYLEAKIKYHSLESIKLIPSLEEAKKIILKRGYQQ